jgi:hypothetical protein
MVEEVEEEVVEEKVTQIIQENVASSSKTIENQKTEEEKIPSSEDVTGDIIEERVEKDIEKAPTPDVAETTEEKAQSEKDTVDDFSFNQSEPKSGVLEVKVNEAKELENKAMLGKSDPYVFIQFEDSKFQSQTKYSNLAPKWSFSTDLNISDDSTNSIQFSVFDDNYGKDQLLGSCSVPVREALQLADKEEQSKTPVTDPSRSCHRTH